MADSFVGSGARFIAKCRNSLQYGGADNHLAVHVAYDEFVSDLARVGVYFEKSVDKTDKRAAAAEKHAADLRGWVDYLDSERERVPGKGPSSGPGAGAKELTPELAQITLGTRERAQKDLTALASVDHEIASAVLDYLELTEDLHRQTDPEELRLQQYDLHRSYPQ